MIFSRSSSQQRSEQNHFVQAIQEFGIEGLLHLGHHLVLHLWRNSGTGGRREPDRAALFEEPRAQVRGHDDDGVLEVHRVAQAVGQLAVFKHLQQDVVDIRMRLLDFVEQDDRIRRALHAFGQLAALFVADVAGRRADQLRDRVLFHELGHIEADQRFFAAEQELGQRAGDFGLADAGGTQEQERSGRDAWAISDPRANGEWRAPARRWLSPG